jgi:hypothetical protein
MRSECDAESSVTDVMVMLVRYWGSDELNCVSAARQS